MNQGELVPDEVTISMLEKEVEKHPEANGFIFDGFPRTTAQAQALDNFLEGRGDSIESMLSLEVEVEELKNRLLARAETSGRADDADPAVIQKRIDVYNAETAPVADFYKKVGKFKSIDGLGSLEDITGRLVDAIG
jgi:adenylate kinase